MNSKKIITNVLGKTILRSTLPIDVRQDETKNYHVSAPSSHLILSSSAGSTITISGSVEVRNDFLVKGDSILSGNVVVGGQLYDLNSNLILSSAAGSVIAASGSLDFTNTDKSYHIRAVNSHLILSSSVGSVVTLSSSLDLPGTDKPYHIRAVNTHLILSSSAGSVIAASGSLDFPNIDKSYHIRAVNSQLILSSSTHSAILISGSRLVFTDDAPGGGNIVNRGGHLILTSSGGSVVKMSGALGAHQLTTATLPSNAIIMTGTIIWDNTTKTMKIYGPEGWSPILTGTAG